MSEKGFKDGLYSKVTNTHSGIKYVISTAQELGKNYWTTVVAPSKFLGLWMDFKKRLVWVRNNKKDAHEVHWKLKEIVKDIEKDSWLELAPHP